jgi:hypothetical protein
MTEHRQERDEVGLEVVAGVVGANRDTCHRTGV